MSKFVSKFLKTIIFDTLRNFQMGTSVVFLLFTNFVNHKNRAIKFVGDSLLIFWTHDIIFLLFQLQSSSPRELNHGSRGLLLFLHIPISLSCHEARGIAGGARGKETWDSDSILGSGRSPEGGNENTFQYSCLENPTDRGAWWASVHRITKSQTQLKQLSTHVPQDQYDSGSATLNSLINLKGTYWFQQSRNPS